MIKRIQWNGYKVLGNLDLDFANGSDSAYQYIVLAGENGTGKSTILDSIALLFSGDFAPFAAVECFVNDTLYRITQRIVAGRAQVEFSEKSTSGVQFQAKPFEISSIPLLLEGGAISRARLGFSTDRITHTGASELDKIKFEADRDQNYTSLKQLLVDIYTRDNETIRRVMDTNGGQVSYDACGNLLKLKRFSDAFNGFFEELKFKGIESRNGAYQVLFEKNGVEIPIEDLSTGEKQIVFRGALLLKNVKAVPSGIVLIDEPELSMHPKWQKRILKYYQDLFRNNDSGQVQLIFATHSPYVIEEALKHPDDTLVITLEDKRGMVEAKPVVAPTVLPIVTAAEVNFEVFGVASLEYHNQLFEHLKNSNSLTSVKDVDIFIENSAPFNPSVHRFPSRHPVSQTQYNTLPTFIRNLIDHPDFQRTFSDGQLLSAIQLLRELLRFQRPSSIH